MARSVWFLKKDFQIIFPCNVCTYTERTANGISSACIILSVHGILKIHRYLKISTNKLNLSAWLNTTRGKWENLFFFCNLGELIR